MKTFISGIMSGLLVSIGGTVFLACDSRYVGAVMFAVALLCICYKGYYLFTGAEAQVPGVNGAGSRTGGASSGCQRRRFQNRG